MNEQVTRQILWNIPAPFIVLMYGLLAAADGRLRLRVPQMVPARDASASPKIASTIPSSA